MNQIMNTNKDPCSEQTYPCHQVDHFTQRYVWDCGVSCVMMLLSSRDRQRLTEELQHEGDARTWTIDLCYLLKRFEIKHTMYTTLAGVNDHFIKKQFYTKSIECDRPRVESLFAQASANGVQVREQSLSMARLIAHLRRGPAILLVDAGLLACDVCKHNKLKAEFRSWFGGRYRGHYILVVGHTREKVLYRDPSLAPRVCVGALRCVARAAAAHGTDDDCILIYNYNTTP